jgi:hypothetical protein
MIINVIGHWLFGLPVGYALCFWYAWGVLGLWIGSLDWVDLHGTRARPPSGGTVHNTMRNDAHCHFFSTAFFSALSRQRAAATACRSSAMIAVARSRHARGTRRQVGA